MDQIQLNEFKEKVFQINTSDVFDACALELFQHQYENCAVYKTYVDVLKVDPSSIKSSSDIPFLPIEFFKTKKIICGDREIETVFYSSGTGNEGRSAHHVLDVKLYEKSFRAGFEHAYGDIDGYCFMVLLPSYYDNENSSLIYMMSDLLEKTEKNGSGVFDKDPSLLEKHLNKVLNAGKRMIVVGVSYALLDFVELADVVMPGAIIMETGGMKGRRKEMVRSEMHQILKDGFKVWAIQSEYGMTELLSQAYSKANGIFNCPPWMKVLIRDTNDPLSIVGSGINGGINVIDLANVHSCAFVATQDIGKQNDKGAFEVLGRFDNSDARGCNLMHP
ncbi:MAG: acyl transferase [Flavobacteriales bacterium]|nr:acyl transferase [Flavobacteriales bacterium]